MRALAVLLAALLLVALAAVTGTRGPQGAEGEAAPWTFGQAMSQRRSYIAAEEIGGLIYAAGGMVGETGRPLGVLQRYDPREDSWTTLTRLPEPTRAAAAAAVDGILYVAGGTTPGGNTAALWAYDPAADEWTGRAPMPAARFNHAALALDGKVWVLGGFLEGRERRDVFVYDPATDSWSEGPPLPFPNHAFDAVAFRGEIWMIGGLRGEEKLPDVWILDPDGGWRRGPAMPKPMELLGAAVAGDEIHAVWESVYQIYDAGTGTWRDGPRSLVTRHGLQAFYADGMLLTVGGCTTALRDSQVVERRILPAR
ncbi:MAG TPA: kelch repeat-containing protein [Gaiellaceae bacterium]|nr:kelch repeat-containing protein [Gaiellaceae bacterium]